MARFLRPNAVSSTVDWRWLTWMSTLKSLERARCARTAPASGRSKRIRVATSAAPTRRAPSEKAPRAGVEDRDARALNRKLAERSRTEGQARVEDIVAPRYPADGSQRGSTYDARIRSICTAVRWKAPRRGGGPRERRLHRWHSPGHVLVVEVNVHEATGGVDALFDGRRSRRLCAWFLPADFVGRTGFSARSRTYTSRSLARFAEKRDHS